MTHPSARLSFPAKKQVERCGPRLRGTVRWFVFWVSVAGTAVGQDTQKLHASDPSSQDTFGSSVSVDGDIAVVGAAGTEAAYVFRQVDGSWVHQQKLQASDGGGDDLFGRTVSISGNVIIVAALKDDNRRGAVYVFRSNGLNWVEEQKLIPDDYDGDIHHFGDSASVSGDVILVGAGADRSFKGSAYIYRYDGDSWALEQKVIASDGSFNDYFGVASSISGDIAAVGAYGVRSKEGAIYVFRFDGDSWNQEQILRGDQTPGVAFGISVASSGDLIVGGAPRPGNGNPAGSAYVYRDTESGWVMEHRLVASDAAPEDHCGLASVHAGAGEGGQDLALIGAPHDDDFGTNSGSAYIYAFDGSSWIEERKLSAFDGADSDGFGSSIAIRSSLCGAVALVGSPGDDDWAHNSGSAWVFGQSGFATDIRRARYDQPTQVTIVGCGFESGTDTQVLFGSLPAENVVVVDDNTITCDTPRAEPGQLDVDVTVQNSQGSTTIPKAFTFTPAMESLGHVEIGDVIHLTCLLDVNNGLFAIYGLPPEVSLETPPFDGRLCIDQFYYLIYTPRWPFERFEIAVNIPDDPTLSGMEILFQALIGPNLGPPKNAAWTNCTMLTID